MGPSVCWKDIKTSTCPSRNINWKKIKIHSECSSTKCTFCNKNKQTNQFWEAKNWLLWREIGAMSFPQLEFPLLWRNYLEKSEVSLSDSVFLIYFFLSADGVVLGGVVFELFFFFLCTKSFLGLDFKPIIRGFMYFICCIIANFPLQADDFFFKSIKTKEKKREKTCLKWSHRVWAHEELCDCSQAELKLI